MGGKRLFHENFLHFFFASSHSICSENTKYILTSEKPCRIGIEISVTAKEVAAITKENSQKCFKQTDLKEN